MSDRTQFNSELFAAEHLMIEDEIASTDIRNRRSFGARIKDFTVNDLQSYHAKRVDALSIEPFWRVSITVNDEPEDLLILPPIDESPNCPPSFGFCHNGPSPRNSEATGSGSPISITRTCSLQWRP
jgi:hypothetical protein